MKRNKGENSKHVRVDSERRTRRRRGKVNIQ